MQKINFMYSNSNTPTGSGEGLGLKKGLMLTEADYYGAMEFDNNDYILVKATEDEYNHYPELLNKFLVLPALVDIYKDGSGTLYVSQEQDAVCKQIQKYIAVLSDKKRIENVNDIVTVYSGVHYGNKLFDLLTDEKYTYGCDINAVAILPSVFDEMNETIKNNHESFYDLASKQTEKMY